MQEVIGLVGYVNKTDYVLNLAKVLNIMGKNVLVVDGTAEQKLKYTIPTLKEKEKAYVTQYDSIDFAVGFKNLHDVENYICKRELNIGLYDYILLDIDNPDSYEGMRTRGIDKTYFFVEYTNISMAKNAELLKTMMVYKPLDRKLELRKLLFKYYITRASEKYYEEKLENFAVDWGDSSYELPYEDQDRIADIETQQSGINEIMRHTKQFIITIAEMASEILKEFTSAEIRKQIKEYSRRNR